MSEWLDVPDGGGLYERKMYGTLEPCWVLSDSYRCLKGQDWHSFPKAGVQFRRIHTGTKAEVTAGKAVLAAMAECRRLDRGDDGNSPHNIYICEDEGGGFGTSDGKSVGLCFGSLAELHEKLTKPKPKPLVWTEMDDDYGSTAFRSGIYRLSQVVRRNEIHWKPEAVLTHGGGSTSAATIGDALQNLSSAKYACQNHYNESMT